MGAAIDRGETIPTSRRSTSLSSARSGRLPHTTGWKIGYVAAPEPLMAEESGRSINSSRSIRTRRFSTPTRGSCVEVPTTTRWRRSIQEKRDRFLQLIEGSRFKLLPCQGKSFQLLDYSAISTERDDVFAIRLLEEHGVASIPTSAFLYRSDPPMVLRFCFAKKEETLQQAADRLRRV